MVTRIVSGSTGKFIYELRGVFKERRDGFH